MTDTATMKPVQVKVANSGPYIDASVHDLDQIVAVLERNGIPHWVSHVAVSVNRQPATRTININKNVDSERVQSLLDSAK